jgi:hypothetical protein
MKATRLDTAEQDHWTERGRATSVANADALDWPRHSLLSLAERNPMPTVADYEDAMRSLPPPSANIRRMLSAHYRAKNRTSIARKLATAAGYKSWRGFNLQYGLLARRIGDKMKIKKPHIGLLVEFEPPGALRNEEWLVFMREDFATALNRVGWI